MCQVIGPTTHLWTTAECKFITVPTTDSQPPSAPVRSDSAVNDLVRLWLSLSATVPMQWPFLLTTFPKLLTAAPPTKARSTSTPRTARSWWLCEISHKPKQATCLAVRCRPATSTATDWTTSSSGTRERSQTHSPFLLLSTSQQLRQGSTGHPLTPLNRSSKTGFSATTSHVLATSTMTGWKTTSSLNPSTVRLSLEAGNCGSTTEPRVQ